MKRHGLRRAKARFCQLVFLACGRGSNDIWHAGPTTTFAYAAALAHFLHSAAAQRHALDLELEADRRRYAGAWLPRFVLAANLTVSIIDGQRLVGHRHIAASREVVAVDVVHTEEIGASVVTACDPDIDGPGVPLGSCGAACGTPVIPGGSLKPQRKDDGSGVEGLTAQLQRSICGPLFVMVCVPTQFTPSILFN